MPRPTLAALLAVLAAMGLASCAGSPEPQSKPLPETLTVSVLQGRLDVPARRIVVKFENAGAETIVVDRVSVESPTLAEPVVRTDLFELTAGDRIDIRLPLPSGTCDGADGATPVVDVRATVDGEQVAGELVPGDQFEVFRTVNDADCLAESVDAVAAIELPERLTVTGSGADARASIEIGVRPVASGDGTLAIESVSDTTLLNAEAGGEWPIGAEVAAGDPESTVVLEVRPARCDAHAIADDKRGTILPFAVRTSDGRSGVLEIASGDALKSDLYTYISDRCGLS